MLPHSPKSSGRRARSRRAVALLSTCAALQLAGTVARGGSFTWNNSYGNWSDASKWVGGAAPTGNDPTDVLKFGGFGFNLYVATNDVADPFLLNQLILTNGSSQVAHYIDGLPLRFEGPMRASRRPASRDPLTFTKPVHVESSGAIDTMNRNHVWSAPITGTGSLVKNGSATLRLAASGSFDGTLVHAAGTTIVPHTVDYPNADVDVQAGTFGGAGSVGGHVTVRSGATLSPGDAINQPGIFSAGQLTHLNGSNLRLQIAGRDNSVPAAAEYDAVHVTSAAELAGKLSADVTGGFAPAWGDVFMVMTWGSRSGRFGTYEFSGAAANFTFAPTYGPGALTLTYARFGDANLDRAVNLQDFNTLAANFGATGAEWSQADFNLDGNVNLSDFNLLAANFGLSAAGPIVTPQDWSALASAVPEPGGLAWAAAGLPALRRRRRR